MVVGGPLSVHYIMRGESGERNPSLNRRHFCLVK